MIEEIKKIKLEELSKQKAEYDEKKNYISQNSNNLHDKLRGIQKEQLSFIITVPFFEFKFRFQ